MRRTAELFRSDSKGFRAGRFFFGQHNDRNPKIGPDRGVAPSTPHAHQENHAICATTESPAISPMLHPGLPCRQAVSMRMQKRDVALQSWCWACSPATPFRQTAKAEMHPIFGDRNISRWCSHAPTRTWTFRASFPVPPGDSPTVRPQFARSSPSQRSPGHPAEACVPHLAPAAFLPFR